MLLFKGPFLKKTFLFESKNLNTKVSSLFWRLIYMKQKSGMCKSCMGGSWLFSAAIIVLVWVWPAMTWSKIVITVLAALLLLGGCCPCRKK